MSKIYITNNNKSIDERIEYLEKIFDAAYIANTHLQEERRNQEVQEQINDLLIKATEKIEKIENKNEMNLLDKIKAGIPVRLKVWLKDMFIIYDCEKLLLINIQNNSLIEINDILLLLKHAEDEWEEYEIPKKVTFSPDEFNFFFNEIYSRLIDSEEVNTTEKSTLIHMKNMLLKRVKNK